MKYLKFIIFFIIVFFTLQSCEEKTNVTISDSMLLPAGRSFLNGSKIDITINGTKYIPDTVFDSCGGYWFRINKADIAQNGEITIQYTRKKCNLALYKESKPNRQRWLGQSQYIDCNNEKIKTKAIELTKDHQSTVDKAKQIHLFIYQNISLQIYKNSFLDKASRTLELGYGSCMNYSRLYVALCRAVNIPARSVWGVIYGYNNDNIYDYHHQWGEILDDTGYWHQADFNYTKVFDLNNIQYTDLLYAAEENDVVNNRANEEIHLGTIRYFDNYPATLTGKLGFELLENKRPEYMTIRYTFDY